MDVEMDALYDAAAGMTGCEHDSLISQVNQLVDERNTIVERMNRLVDRMNCLHMGRSG